MWQGNKRRKEEQIKVQTKKDHTPKVQNAQWGALRGENTKPITSSKKLSIPGISSDAQ
jgi:hypothetical protein